jgi:hypothetical protein
MTWTAAVQLVFLILGASGQPILNVPVARSLTTWVIVVGRGVKGFELMETLRERPGRIEYLVVRIGYLGISDASPTPISRCRSSLRR